MYGKSIARGLLGAVGIWLTAGLALPFVNVLKSFTPEQLMFARGLMTAIFAVLIMKGKVFPIDRYTLLSGVGFAFGCLGLYHGIRELGPSLAIIIITTAPIVNFLFAWGRGRHVSFAAIGSLVVMLAGVVFALHPWSSTTTLTFKGVAWSIFGATSGALYYEALSKAKGSRLTRCFWQALVVALIAISGNLISGSSIQVPEFKTVLLLVAFALMGGFLYFIANIEAFDNLPTEVASVLAQGETPAVIIMAGVLLGEKLSLSQWLGVAVALLGAGYLSRWISNQQKVS